jgi:hypothetical protein
MRGELLLPVRALLREMRYVSSQHLLRAVQAAMISNKGTDDIDARFYCELCGFSQRILDLFRNAPRSLIEHPIISSLLIAANEERLRRSVLSVEPIY